MEWKVVYKLKCPPVSDSALRWGVPRSAPMRACIPLLIGCLLAVVVPLASSGREALAAVGAFVTLAPLSMAFRSVVMDGGRLLKRDVLWRSFDLCEVASVRGFTFRGVTQLEVTDHRGDSFLVSVNLLPKQDLAAFCSELWPYLTREGVEQKGDVVGVLRHFGGQPR